MHAHTSARRRKKTPMEVTFVAAKSRVAPLKQLTIPRLELQAAVLASRLAKSILDESRIQFESVKFLTDSTITLAWIQCASRSFKPFVSSRVGEIQSKSDPSQWNHIPSEENVANDLSRGLRVQQLTGRWMNGPRFLTLPEEQWPVQTVMPSPAEHNMERRHVNAVSAASQVDIGNVFDPKVFTSWRKTDTRNGMGRLAEKIHSRRNHLGGPLMPEELAKAEILWIRSAQRSLQKRLENGEFKTLSPFVDGKGINRGWSGESTRQSCHTKRNIQHCSPVTTGYPS